MGCRASIGLMCAVFALAVAPVTAAPPAKSASVSASTAADCDHLLAQFDVAWTAHSSSKRADAARRARDFGEVACRDGRYADGVHQLKRALHDLGLKPVHRSTGSPSH